MECRSRAGAGRRFLRMQNNPALNPLIRAQITRYLPSNFDQTNEGARGFTERAIFLSYAPCRWRCDDCVQDMAYDRARAASLLYP